MTAPPPADREGADAGVGTGTGAAVERTGKAFPGMKGLEALEATSSFVFIDHRQGGSMDSRVNDDSHAGRASPSFLIVNGGSRAGPTPLWITGRSAAEPTRTVLYCCMIAIDCDFCPQ